MKKIIANSLLQIKHQEEEQGSVDLIQRSQPFKFSTSKHFVSSHVDITLKIAAKRRAYYELIRKTSS